MNERLGKIVSTAPPINGGKRKAFSMSSKDNDKTRKKPKTDLESREQRALEQLRQFILEKGGNENMITGYRCRATRKAGNRFDITFYDAQSRRFRSMLQVARFHKLVNESSPKRKPSKVSSTKSQEAEKKKIRKEIENLRKMQNRATKALNEWDNTHPEEKDIVDVDQVFPTAAARVPDFAGFPGLPEHCTPDVLMAWDFLSTFERTLALAPLDLDDFAQALCYRPPEGQIGDDILSAPVYLAEAHLGLLKFLYSDPSSDEWWWSNLETEETEGVKTEKEDVDDGPSIHFNIAASLTISEDPLLTQSWLQALEQRNQSARTRIINALRVVSNKWIAAYLRKSLKIASREKAVNWLIRRMRQARPDLSDGNVSQTTLNMARAKAIEEADRDMQQLPASAPKIIEEDVVSDWEDQDDESDDDSDADEAETENQDLEHPASVIPPKPFPTPVDLLLPPEKPSSESDFVNAFTWPQMVGATVARILHRKKRMFNEMDDKIRESRELPPLTVEERRRREAVIVSRVLTECGANCDVEETITALCKGGSYLELEPTQRLCVLRLLIDSAYDTKQLQDVMRTNHSQRTNAIKALDVEQRRAKREIKEKAAADERAARQRLASDCRNRFIDEKREEIRKLNARSNEFPDEIIDAFTDEEIIDFDDDVRADYDALPAAESFSKIEVSQMVVRLHEEAAFDTHLLHVLTMDELLDQEQQQLKNLKKELLTLDNDESMDREVVRTVDRLRREIERLQSNAEALVHQREKAIAQLKDAMADGTIKALRNAFVCAKKAKLMGNDDVRGGIWVLDTLRTAGLELEKAKQNKRVFDAQKDLVAKMNRCFIRTEPLGYDCHGNRFWSFKTNDASDERMHVWTETELRYSKDCQNELKPPPGCLNLYRRANDVLFGEKEIEGDLLRQDCDEEKFRLFSRKEYHSSGAAPFRSFRLWGCHSTEDSIRGVIKNLDSRLDREGELKAYLKETLEETVGTGEKAGNGEDEFDEHESFGLYFSGDEDVFAAAKIAAKELNDVSTDPFDSLRSAIGSTVRIRQILDTTKDSHVSRYLNGEVNAWRLASENLLSGTSDEEVESKVDNVPVWRVSTERGHQMWLKSVELLESLSRYLKWKEEPGYFENDASFFVYRNSLGRYCGRAVDAPFASSPFHFAKAMMKKEAELYPKLKSGSFDNTWGGQSGARALWTNSMRDYAYDFETVKQGLLTLEGAVFDLTGGFSDYKNIREELGDIPSLLQGNEKLFDVELESMDFDLPGLWNSPNQSSCIHPHR